MNGKKFGIIITLVILAVLFLWLKENPNQPSKTSSQNPSAQVKEVQTQQKVLIKDITAQEASDLTLKNKENPDFLIIDVRTAKEYETGHIENAVNIDYSSASFKDRLDELDKNKTYLIYCRSGTRSKKALELMSKLGFAQVYNLHGGITSWVAQGLPTVK